jgi:PAS domain S-box-containing protein
MLERSRSQPSSSPNGPVGSKDKRQSTTNAVAHQRGLTLETPIAEPAKANVSSEGVDTAESASEEVAGAEEDRDADQVASVSPGLTDSQLQLNHYREELARDLERRELVARSQKSAPPEKSRVSPIQEEMSGSPPPSTSGLPTTSTESANTIRGGFTPGFTAATPSYPFPRMATTPGVVPSYLHRPFTTLSPTTRPSASQVIPLEHLLAHDNVLSGSSTPASTMTFHPSGSMEHPDARDFPSPNLYDLSLMLTAEPGLDAWWNTVVQIMTDVYRAERVTLSIPADTTDIENVPWGQKATYNEHDEDELSLGYMARGSSLIPSSTGDVSEKVSNPEERPKPQARPSLLSRHSFTSYEENKERNKKQATEKPPTWRPSQLSRSKSYFPPGGGDDSTVDGPAQLMLNKTTLAQHDAVEEEQSIPPWEAPLVPKKEGQGRVLPVLQALDYEADPLIDHTGVTRVLDRGKVIALTRSYPYLQNAPEEQVNNALAKITSKTSPAETAKRKIKKPRPESTPKLSSILSSANVPRSMARASKEQSSDRNKSAGMMSRFEDEPPRPRTPRYEEYEQAPPSPWSQSPAPSPAVRSDPKENPFFTDAMVDEDSFNPDTGTQDYTLMRPPEAIGVDNSWTVLHVPLTHVLLSKTIHPFKLDSTVMEQKSQSRSSPDAKPSASGDAPCSPTFEESKRNKPAPIAILSILSPIIPYPSNLRHSLEHLAPHLATSFSLCRHYTNLETELAGLQRRRPPTAGFGALAADGRPLVDSVSIANLAYLPTGELGIQRSLAGSITSPSDYSGLSRSAAGSPNVTPGWEQGTTLGFLTDKRQSSTSPAQIGGDGYFSTKQRPSLARADTGSGGVPQQPRKASKENSPIEKRQPRLSGDGDTAITVDIAGRKSDEAAPLSITHRGVPSRDGKETLQDSKDELLAADKAVQTPLSEARANLAANLAELSSVAANLNRHTQLHSYGADFATTFQSLPPSSSVTSSRTIPYSAPSRSGSISVGPADMPPPSDRLKGLILDSLPAHVFVALPQTGEIVWVNSRYLTYRGQTVADLAVDPWCSIHQDDREEYLKAWSHSLKTGEQFSRTVRIKRFDGAYRWFYARAVASRDKRGVIMQFLGSYMDIHDQHIAELKAARQEEIEASEAQHRLLANLIPQIIFTATEDEGITFANEQWLSYTGQRFEDSLGLGFMNHVHPEDLAKCRIPTDKPPTPLASKRSPERASFPDDGNASKTQQSNVDARAIHQALSRNSSSSSSSMYDMPTADLSKLAKKGIIKVTTDSNGRLSYTTELRLRSKSGEYRWHLIRCVEIDNIDFGSGASSYFGSATDINDHKLLEAKLKEAMESKSRFLSNMSHEIRTPLIGISGMVSFLQDTTLNEEQRDYTNTIQTSANSLLMIINDILDLSKVDAGMMKLKYEWFHTRSLIEDVNELVSTMAIAKRLELNYIVEENVPTWLKGDKVRIRQVLLNVIGNAIKFTTEGEVFSRCRVYTDDRPSPDNEIMLEFAIIDTGRGFTQEEAELIFKPFSQIDGSSTRQHGGSGLGLVISRQLVELHGGKMEGTAVAGKGSTFTFTAKFTLPTDNDQPDALRGLFTEGMRDSTAVVVLPPQPRTTSASGRLASVSSANISPSADSVMSPTQASSGSSDPSLNSGRSHGTDRTSASSVNVGLVRFSEAARASGQDLSQMKLEMPSGSSSQGVTPTPGNSTPAIGDTTLVPPMYSILILCPQSHSREATTRHIEMTIPKNVPYQITPLAKAEDAQKLICGDNAVIFTHIVINLPSAEEILDMIEKITTPATGIKTSILILADSVLRQTIVKLAANTQRSSLLSENPVSLIYKPVKPSRFAVIFDPEKLRDFSIDRNRSTAQRMVESQKASYLEIEKRMGNKGYKVLLVEDNRVNQKVLMKYLKKVGVTVEVAADGVECIEKVLSQPQDYFSLILVSPALVDLFSYSFYFSLSSLYIPP